MKNAFVKLFAVAFIGLSTVCQPSTALPDGHPRHPHHPLPSSNVTLAVAKQLDVLTTSCVALQAHQHELVDVKAGVVKEAKISNVVDDCHQAFKNVSYTIDTCSAVFANINGTTVSEDIKTHIGITISDVHGSLDVVLTALVDVRAQIEASTHNVEVFVQVCVEIKEKLQIFLDSIHGTIDIDTFTKLSAQVHAVVTLLDDKKDMLQ